jgi:hypothetical protein
MDETEKVVLAICDITNPNQKWEFFKVAKSN